MLDAQAVWFGPGGWVAAQAARPPSRQTRFPNQSGAYVLYWTLEHEHRRRGSTLTGRRVLEALAQIQLGTIVLKTQGGMRLNLQHISGLTFEQRELRHGVPASN